MKIVGYTVGRGLCYTNLCHILTRYYRSTSNLHCYDDRYFIGGLFYERKNLKMV